VRGALLVSLILILAALLSGFAWWHQWQRGRAAIETWGAAGAYRIRVAKSVECWELQPGSIHAPPEDTLSLPQAQVRTISRRIAAARWNGLIHLRQALIDDASYELPNPSKTERGGDGATGAKEGWEAALRFASDGQDTVLVFDLESGRVHQLGRGRTAQLNSQVAQGVRQILSEHGVPSRPHIGPPPSPER